MSGQANNLSEVAKGIGLLILCGIAFFILLIVAFGIKVHADTERRIQRALKAHYAGTSMYIAERDDFDFGNQVCFGVHINNLGSAKAERFAMIEGGSDGGYWEFRREHPSMQDCQRSYNRG